MTKTTRSAALAQVVFPVFLLLVLSLLFWKFRIFDSGTNPTIELGNVDLYIEVTPMNTYAFEALRHGHLPLWNPYQFCGEPFLAMAYVGLFYPLRLINLFFDVLTSFEISVVTHMFFGALSMFFLARHFGIKSLGAFCAAVTFVWSGWLIHNNTLPGVFEGMTWMPMTVLLLDLVLLGRRSSWLWLTLALTSELLLGVPEILVHTLYVTGVFAACRLVQMTWNGAGGIAVRRLMVIGLSGSAALLLAAPQLLPAMELTEQSSRAAGTLSFVQAAAAAIPPVLFLRAAVTTRGAVNVGLLPLFGIVLVLGAREQRMVWVGALIAAIGAALLVFGGPVYRLYYGVPVIGSMFRRPMKFLDIYVFAQAVIAGVAFNWLQSRTCSPRRAVWVQANWLAAVVLGTAATTWVVWEHEPCAYWVAALALLVAFGVSSSSRSRIAILTALCMLQGANLFFTVSDTHVRPIKRPEIFFTYRSLLDELKGSLGNARVYLSSKLWFLPGLTPKQGLITETAVVSDYEPLAVGRYGAFFESISARADVMTPFFGSYSLTANSRWRLMDLTGTKYFVMQRGEPGDTFMAQNPAGFRVVYDRWGVRVFEQRKVLPRAYLVSRARVLPTEAVLPALDNPEFDPRKEVVLEDDAAGSPPLPAGADSGGAVRITSYAPEGVEIAVNASGPGYLVLTDLHYPGWKAFIGEHEVPVYRANYLFRAVPIERGRSVVRFEYQPKSFRIGLWLSGATAAVLMVIIICTYRHRRTSHGGLAEKGHGTSEARWSHNSLAASSGGIYCRDHVCTF